jgi:membrane protein YqaA with SNARE-associated domain
MRARLWLWIAFFWGLADTTIFFIVPDVYLTRLAIRDSLGRAWLAAASAVVGALIVGTILWIAGQEYHDAVWLLKNFDYLPGINRDLIVSTGTALFQRGPAAFIAGGMIGQPYKLFAVHAGAQHVPLATFLMFSLVARSLRFAATTCLAWLLNRGLQHWHLDTRLRAHLLLWVILYVLYFAIVR